MLGACKLSLTILARMQVHSIREVKAMQCAARTGAAQEAGITGTPYHSIRCEPGEGQDTDLQQPAAPCQGSAEPSGIGVLSDAKAGDVSGKHATYRYAHLQCVSSRDKQLAMVLPQRCRLLFSGACADAPTGPCLSMLSVAGALW